MSKVQEIPNPERDERKASLAKLERLLGDMSVDYKAALLVAKYRKVQFDAHIEAGFTEPQAAMIVAKL